MIVPKLDITQDLDTGLTIRVDDITGAYTTENPGGYGFPNPEIYEVNRVRFLFSSYLSIISADQNVTECIASVEYQVYGSGNSTVDVDGKSFILGDKFIIETDATPVIGTGLLLKETGRFATITNFLPNDLFIDFVPSQTGNNQLIFQDSAYQSLYQVFITQYFSGASFPAGTYIVKGDPLKRIQVTSTGFEYNAGEVFAVSGADTFTDITGTNSICKLEADTVYNFPLIYYAWQAKNVVEQQYVLRNCGCKEKYAFALSEIQSRLDAIAINYEDDLNNDDSGTQAMLDDILSIANVNCP